VRRRQLLGHRAINAATEGHIPTISGYRPATAYHGRREERNRVLRTVRTTAHQPVITSSGTVSPSLYVLNAASLSKPYAIEQLAADLSNYNIDVAAISETHFKTKHTDSVVTIDGYTLLRRDRKVRRGGGVAMYVRKSYTCSPTVWTYSADDRTYELLWVQVGAAFIGVIYHPPRPTYTAESMLYYIESCIDEILRGHPNASIILAGDFNQLSHDAVVEHTGLTQIVSQPTRGPNILDRIYESCPTYSVVRVVRSVLRSDHRAVLAYQERSLPMTVKVRNKVTFRRRTPTQHAQFLQCFHYINREPPSFYTHARRVRYFLRYSPSTTRPVLSRVFHDCYVTRPGIRYF